MNFLENAINKNLQWFIRSGVMIPDNGLWGVAERLAVKSGNQALEKTLEAFPAWTDQEECYTIEQRRADCNFQTAWLFLLADKLFPGANYGEIGRNISDFLYFRSGLLERNKNVPVPGNWNWSHIMRDNRIWFDDQSWCLFIQLKIAGEFPELDKKYRMTHWAGLLAESLYTALSDANARTHWNGNPDHPHWGALATMALAQAATDDTKEKYAAFCREYFTNLVCPNVSETAYALIGAVNCALKLDFDFFIRFAEKYADEIISKIVPETGFPPSEHQRETPAGSHLIDLIYTVNWTITGLRELGLIAGEKYSAYARKMIDSLCEIQDTSNNPCFNGCWRGMYDSRIGSWGGGDLFEGGGSSIYTGWTNAPIALNILFENQKKSMF